MRDDRELRLKVSLGMYLLLLYSMCYFLLYTYSFLGIDILYPYYIFGYLGLIVGFLVLYRKFHNRLSKGYNKTLLIVFALLPILMVTSMFQEPMTTGAVVGAGNGFQDLGDYLKYVPWSIFKDFEVSLLYVKIPSLISLGSVIAIFFVKRREVLVVVPLLIFMYILCLIPYLLWAETFIDCGH